MSVCLTFHHGNMQSIVWPVLTCLTTEFCGIVFMFTHLEFLNAEVKVEVSYFSFDNANNVTGEF